MERLWAVSVWAAVDSQQSENCGITVKIMVKYLNMNTFD